MWGSGSKQLSQAHHRVRGIDRLSELGQHHPHVRPDTFDLELL
jgi:hypothetical protein